VSSLTTTFLERLGGPVAAKVRREEVEVALAAFVDAAARAHPELGIDRDALVARAGELVAEAEDPLVALASLHAADLLLAFACARGDARALAIFEQQNLSQVPAFVAHLGFDATTLAELVQALRGRLLVGGPEGAAKIAGYTGRGPLGGWLRVSAIRLALTMRRERGAERRRDDAMIEPAAALDPELRLLKETYRREFKEAFDRAITSLESDERAVLRLHYVDGLGIDQIGVAFGVHRATAARWIAGGRERIAAATRRDLKERLKLSERDLESVLRLVESQMDVTLERALDGPSAGK
jgi:RNA polymerase sigma-70 factor (ECF subfamily)